MAETHREEIAKLEALYAGNPGGRVFVHLAEAYRKAGEHERARRILDEGLARHTDSASGHVVLGRVLADMQITAEAEIAFRRVLELDAGNLIALRWLGDLARQSGRNAEAAMHYRELLIRNPSNEEVRDLVEIVEREAVDDAGHGGIARGGPAVGPDAEDGADDAFAGLTLATDEDREEPAVSPPVSDAETPAVSPPAHVARAPEPDVTPWSAAPGQTGDAEAPPVEYGVVELDSDVDSAPEETATAAESHSPSEADATARDAVHADEDAFHVASEEESPAPDEGAAAPDRYAADRGRGDRAGVFEFAREDESDLVSSVGEDDIDVVELDELRRDDEAEPVEIHLLDPSYEPSGDEDDDEYVGDLDLSDLADTVPIEDSGDYADDSFLADLSAAGEEKPPADELPGAVDVMDAALTLLPDAGDGAADEARPAEHEVIDTATARTAGPDTGASGMAIEGAEPEMELQEAGMAAHEPDVDAAEPQDAEPVFGAHEPPGPESEAHSKEQGDADSDRSGGDLTSADLADLSGALEPAAEAYPVGGAPEPVGADDVDTAPITDAQEAVPEPEEALTDSEAAQPAALAGPEEAGRVAEVRPGTDTGLMTETMAVLYRSQGFHDRAADVYRALLRARPDDERLAAKLREAEQAAGSPGGRAGAPEPASEDEAGEVWLRGVGAAWTGPAEVSAEDATPYAWTGEADETEGGEPISSYLQDLVSWKAGSGAWIQPEAASADAAGEIEMPDWLDGPDKTQPWTPDSEPPPYPATPAAEADWSPPSEDTWDAAADMAEPSAGQAEKAAPDEWQVPSDANGAPQASDTDAAESGAGWTPLELDNDVVAPPATPPAETPPAGLQPGPLPEEESSDDDDLEMFRSWLQSLKK